MGKIEIIIQREYLSRVKKKSFLIASILGPIFMAGIFLLPAYLATRGVELKEIIVLDESGFFTEEFTSNDELAYKFFEGDLESAKTEMSTKDFYGLVYVPDLDLEKPGGYKFYSGSNPGLSVVRKIERIIDRKIEDLRLERSGLDSEVINSFKVSTQIDTINLSDSGTESSSSSGAATAIGYVSAFLIYMFIFIYGAQCMRGVIEEKNTRIVEVIVSSVKPFHLMMGKIIGIAAVGLTQFVIWIVLSFSVITVISMVTGVGGTPPETMGGMNAAQNVDPSFVEEAFKSLSAINFTMVVVAFLFFFLGGYLLYGALFAAVGSASDSDADAQQFMLPVTIPLIFAIIMLSAVLTDPDGSLAFWLSMIPFTSPVIMMMRVPFGVEVWELALSIFILIGGFIFTTWLASRIYRVGILMHGTKVNWKVLAKWFMMSN